MTNISKEAIKKTLELGKLLNDASVNIDIRVQGIAKFDGERDCFYVLPYHPKDYMEAHNAYSRAPIMAEQVRELDALLDGLELTIGLMRDAKLCESTNHYEAIAYMTKIIKQARGE